MLDCDALPNCFHVACVEIVLPLVLIYLQHIFFLIVSCVGVLLACLLFSIVENLNLQLIFNFFSRLLEFNEEHVFLFFPFRRLTQREHLALHLAILHCFDNSPITRHTFDNRLYIVAINYVDCRYI